MAWPVSRDIYLYEGDGYPHTLKFPIDVSNRTWSAKWKPNSASTEHIDFTVDASQASSGIVFFTLSPSQVADVASKGRSDGRGNTKSIWEVRSTVGGIPETLIVGDVVCKRRVAP